jgi:hypothetical protein
MHDSLRDRILRKLDPLSDERGYQVLDFIEFLESKYAERTASPTGVFQRFADTVEDTLRAGRVSATAVAETMGLLNKAMGVLSGVAAAGKSVASDVMEAAARTASRAVPDRRDGGASPPIVAPTEGTPATDAAPAAGDGPPPPADDAAGDSHESAA